MESTGIFVYFVMILALVISGQEARPLLTGVVMTIGPVLALVFLAFPPPRQRAPRQSTIPHREDIP